MNRLRSLPILLLLAAGCGSNLGAEQRAKNACPTLTEAEFDLLWSGAVLGRDQGMRKEDVLFNIATWTCFESPTFDRDSECRACLSAIIEGVY